MKVTGYRTSAVKLPTSDPGMSPTMAIRILLHLQTDEGVEGFSYGTRVSEGTVKPFLQVLESCLDQLVGWNPLAIEAISALRTRLDSPHLFRRGGTWPGYQTRIASMIDIALWDLKGKVTNLSVHQLMGGYSDKVACCASYGIEPGTAEANDLGTSARRLVDRGFRAMKFHVRRLDRGGVVDHIRQLREAVGPGVDILVDSYQGWNLKEAVRMAAAIEPYDPCWIEDPIPLDDYEGMRQLRDRVTTSVCAGEQYRDVSEFRMLLEHRSVDIAMVDLDLGFTRFLKIAHLAEAFGVSVVSHLATEIMAPAIAAVPNGLTVEYIPWAELLFREPLVPEDGNLALSSRPGLGLDLDDRAVKSFALN